MNFPEILVAGDTWECGTGNNPLDFAGDLDAHARIFIIAVRCYA